MKTVQESLCQADRERLQDSVAYCNWRERSRILKSLGDTAPSFEETEEKHKEDKE